MFEIAPGLNTWNQQSIIEDFSRQVLSKRFTYEMLVHHQKPARIQQVGMSNATFAAKLSPYKTFCPVSFVIRQIAINVHIPELQQKYAVEYKHLVYCLAGVEEMQQFLLDPERYVHFESKPMPQPLPTSLHDYWTGSNLNPLDELDDQSAGQVENTEEIDGKYALRGYCPVMLSQLQEGYVSIFANFDREPIIAFGKNQYVVKYNDKLYRCATHENMMIFAK